VLLCWDAVYRVSCVELCWDAVYRVLCVYFELAQPNPSGWVVLFKLRFTTTLRVVVKNKKEGSDATTLKHQ